MVIVVGPIAVCRIILPDLLALNSGSLTCCQDGHLQDSIAERFRVKKTNFEDTENDLDDEFVMISSFRGY